MYFIQLNVTDNSWVPVVGGKRKLSKQFDRDEVGKLGTHSMEIDRGIHHIIDSGCLLHVKN